MHQIVYQVVFIKLCLLIFASDVAPFAFLYFQKYSTNKHSWSTKVSHYQLLHQNARSWTQPLSFAPLIFMKIGHLYKLLLGAIQQSPVYILEHVTVLFYYLAKPKFWYWGHSPGIYLCYTCCKLTQLVLLVLKIKHGTHVIIYNLHFIPCKISNHCTFVVNKSFWILTINNYNKSRTLICIEMCLNVYINVTNVTLNKSLNRCLLLQCAIFRKCLRPILIFTKSNKIFLDFMRS